MNHSESNYNSIFESLVGKIGQNPSLIGMIAYGLYKQAKREWSDGIRRKHSRGPTDDELDAYFATWTESRLQGAKKEAEQILAQFADEVISNAKPDIEKQALRGTFRSGILQSMVGSFIYSILLVCIFLIISNLGVDIISLFKK